MTRLANTLINGLWAGSMLPEARAFHRRIPDARPIQEAMLLRFVRQNASTQFGKAHHFDAIHGMADYQARVPIRDYEDFRPYIERIAAGESGVLTAERVLLFEPTGGSESAQPKLIPYTASLRWEFQRAIAPWITDLYRHLPALLSGRSYWSISPVTEGRTHTPGGIPIGFESDSAYLGWKGKLAEQVFAVPPAIRAVTNIENFRYLTALCLLRDRHLGLISVWNPTFLTLILTLIEDRAETLIRDIASGTATLPVEADIRFFRRYLQPAAARARALESALAAPLSIRFKQVWPRLTLLSCWMDGAAVMHLPTLQSYLPSVTIQGKGLIATEGIVSFPLRQAADVHIPAFTSHVMEFLADDSRVYTLETLETGQFYTVILSTGGGLYRYNLNDQVQVTGWWRGLPLLRFAGRNRVSDLVGEKLSERHAQQVIQQTLQQCRVDYEFAMLAPQLLDKGGYYTLFIQTSHLPDRRALHDMQQRLEAGLKENFHYRYARQLQQLQPLKVFLIHGDPRLAYEQRCLAKGQKLGDIKLPYLDRRSDWDQHFTGRYLA